MASCSQLKRLDSASRSPIYSHFGESLNGISTIRAYQAEKRFIQLIEQKVDLNSQFAYPNVACQLWLGLRLQTIGGLVVLYFIMLLLTTCAILQIDETIFRVILGIILKRL